MNTSKAMACQDWAPTSSGASGDSQAESQDMEEMESHMVPAEQEEDPMAFEMNQVYDSLEQNLPEVPLPGPDRPQVLGSRTESKEIETPAPRPVSTPCRGNENSSVVVKTAEDWYHWWTKSLMNQIIDAW